MYKNDLIKKSNETVVKSMIKVLFWAFIPLVALSLSRIIQMGWIPVMGVHLVLVIVIGIFYKKSHEIEINYQAILVVLIFLAIGIGNIFTLNTIAYASGFFIIAMMFSALFFSVSWATIVVLFVIFIQFIFLYFFQASFSIHDFLTVVSVPILGYLATYVVSQMRATLYSVIADLSVAQEKAQSATKAKSHFLAVMSHEIRTPMNGIILAIDNLSEDQFDSETAEYINLIKQSSQSLLGILNDLLDYSKIEAGQLSVEAIPTDLNKICSELTGLFQIIAQKKAVEVSFERDKSLPKGLLTDPVRFRQILTNFLSNSIKFTEKGTVKLQVKLIEKSENAVKVNVIIEDTGIGIKDEHKQLLFQDFQQLDSSITRKYGGTGLGLAITKNLVNLLGGDIVVESEYGRGTKITAHFQFKLSSANENKSTEESSLMEAHAVDILKKSKILVVDDNQVNRRVTEMTLTKLGVGECVFACSGQEAINLCQLSQFDLILMDMQMPVMDGVEATILIKNTSGSKNFDTPIVALTANATTEDKAKCLAAGMQDFLVKPIQKEIFKKILMKLLK